MAAKSSKKISQETFDEVVRENVDDFEMDPPEALADAINQFKMQGVDLTGLDTSGGVGREEALENIKLFVQAVQQKNSNSTIEAIRSVRQLCSKDSSSDTLYLRNINLLMRNEGVNSLHLLLEPSEPSALLCEAMNFLNEISAVSEEIRDFFEPGGCSRVCAIVKGHWTDLSNVLTLGENIFVQDEANTTVISSAFSLSRTVSKTENNKALLMRFGMGELLSQVLTQLSGREEPKLQKVLQDGCVLLRGLCLHDDLRREMSCAYENGRFFLKQNNLAASLMCLSGKFKANVKLASVALSAARNLITTEESVQVMSHHGALDLVKSILSFNGADLPLTKSVLDDVRKDKLVVDGTLDLLIAATGKEEFASDAGCMEHALACLAAISLRSPGNAQRIVDTGCRLQSYLLHRSARFRVAIDIIVKTMRRHFSHQSLQRQGCLTLRNIAARIPEVRSILLDAGAEDVLRSAGRLQSAVDEAYAALRDLGCEVQYVKVNEEGKVEPMYQQFGTQGTVLNFNPVWDDEDGGGTQRMEDLVRGAAKAPFAKEVDHDSEVHDEHCCEGLGHSHDHVSHNSYDHDHDHRSGHREET